MSSNNKSKIKKIKKCENTFCEEYTKKVVKTTMDMINSFASKRKNLDNETKLKIKNMKKHLNSKKSMNEVKKICKVTFCNPSCKGTIYQNNEFPKELENKYSKNKDGKFMIESLKKSRNLLFKGKKTILEDDFYIKLKNKEKLKKEGAISGCAYIDITR